MLEGYKDILSVEDVCEILNVERKLVYKLIKSGELPARKVGGKYRVPKYLLIRYIEDF